MVTLPSRPFNKNCVSPLHMLFPNTRDKKTTLEEKCRKLVSFQPRLRIPSHQKSAMDEKSGNDGSSFIFLKKKQKQKTTTTIF